MLSSGSSTALADGRGVVKFSAEVADDDNGSVTVEMLAVVTATVTCVVTVLFAVVAGMVMVRSFVVGWGQANKKVGLGIDMRDVDGAEVANAGPP